MVFTPIHSIQLFTPIGVHAKLFITWPRVYKLLTANTTNNKQAFIYYCEDQTL